jgi:hypothetical protein
LAGTKSVPEHYPKGIGYACGGPPHQLYFTSPTASMSKTIEFKLPFGLHFKAQVPQFKTLKPKRGQSNEEVRFLCIQPNTPTTQSIESQKYQHQHWAGISQMSFILVERSMSNLEIYVFMKCFPLRNFE